MKNNEHIVAEMIRIEHSEQDDKLFIIFEVTDAKYKQDIKKNWTRDIEFRLIDKQLVKEE